MFSLYTATCNSTACRLTTDTKSGGWTYPVNVLPAVIQTVSKVLQSFLPPTFYSSSFSLCLQPSAAKFHFAGSSTFLLRVVHTGVNSDRKLSKQTFLSVCGGMPS